MPKSTTLDDLERPICTLLQKRCVFWRLPTTKIWMKIDPYYQQYKHRPMTLVSGSTGIRFMQIFAGVLWRGVSNDSGVIKNVDFQGFWTLRLRHLRKWGQHYYIVPVLFSPLSPVAFPVTPQYIWHWMTLTGYFALNSVFAPVWLAETVRLRKIIAWKLIKIDTILSAVQIFGRDSSFWQYKVCTDIRSGSLERRR